MLGTPRVVATTLATLLLASPALAQPKQPSEKDKQIAGDLVKQAIAKSQAKDHLGAIELYQKAYATVSLPTLLSNIATEFQSANKPVEALKWFCTYLEKDPAGTLASYATAQAKVLQNQLGNPVTRDEDVCKPAAPTSPDNPDPGNGSGGVQPPPETPSAQPTSDPGSGLKIGGLVGAGVGVAALGLGIYFGLEAKKISDDISSHTDPMDPWRSDIRDYQAKGQRYENLQIGTLIGGGVLLVGGVALYMLGRSKTSSMETIAVTPAATADSASLVVSGRF